MNKLENGKNVLMSQSEIDEVLQHREMIRRTKAKERQIEELERSITSERLREAVLGIDNGWLQNIHNQIKSIKDEQ